VHDGKAEGSWLELLTDRAHVFTLRFAHWFRHKAGYHSLKQRRKCFATVINFYQYTKRKLPVHIVLSSERSEKACPLSDPNRICFIFSSHTGVAAIFTVSSADDVVTSVSMLLRECRATIWSAAVQGLPESGNEMAAYIEALYPWYELREQKWVSFISRMF
jgi:hypothetical protein